MSIDNCSIVFSSALTDMTPVNASFDRGVLAIAYHGKSRNKTFISKEDFEKAIPTIYNCPIVCNYNRAKDSIGSHDMEVVNDDRGLRLVNLTTPVGVIPESAKVWWEEREDANGETHEYMMTDALIWKRQEAYQHLLENGVTDESMEIKIASAKREDDGLLHIYSFEFTAFCLLESASPCFEGAGLELFSANDFKELYSAMLDDMKREFAQVMTASADDIETQILLKGGNERVDMNELMAKYGLSAEDINFETDGLELEELERRFALLKVQKGAQFEAHEQEGEPEGEPAPVEQPVEEAVFEQEQVEQPAEQEPEAEPSVEGNFSLTINQLSDCLRNALGAQKWKNPHWDNEMATRYWMHDFDAEKCEVYAYDEMMRYVVGMSYTMDGDNPVIDFEGAKRKKVVYEDFEEGKPIVDLSAVFEAMCHEARLPLNNELEELRKFKMDTLTVAREADEKRVFASFADLEGNEVFEQLKSNCAEMTIEQIEEKCFSIRGRMASVQSAKFSLNNEQTIQLPVEEIGGKNNDEPYGGIFVRFGIGQR